MQSVPINWKAKTADGQLKSATIQVSLKQTDNSHKIEGVWDLPPSSYAEQCTTMLKMKMLILS